MVIEKNKCEISTNLFLEVFMHGQDKTQSFVDNTIYILREKSKNNIQIDDISLDKEDVLTIAEDSKTIQISSIESSTIIEGIRYLINSILLQNNLYKLSKGILFYLKLKTDYNFSDIQKSMDEILDVMDEDINFVLCTTLDKKLKI